jgi:hypothetical protein
MLHSIKRVMAYFAGLGTLVLIAVQFIPVNQLAKSVSQMAVPNSDYEVTLETKPTIVEAGKPFDLKLQIFQTDGKTPVTKFDEVHTKLLHFIIVSEDLKQFMHVHPDYDGNGVFTLKQIALPVTANYIMFADFTPTGDKQQAVRLTLAIKDAQSSPADLKVSVREAAIGALKFTLDVPDTLNAGTENKITFHVSDAKTGEPVKDLDEYLGAAGHLVILNRTAEVYIHTHPAGHDMGDMSGMEMNAKYGPDVVFEAHFPDTGLYGLWLQVQYKGEVLTVPFVVKVTGKVEVTPGTQVTPEATMDMGSMSS